ncbi:MAG: hypothetical protein J6N52_06070 [Clostridia bacterium]|nr:hypothetical protein [Clostridia bacterium]
MTKKIFFAVIFFILCLMPAASADSGEAHGLVNALTECAEYMPEDSEKVSRALFIRAVVETLGLDTKLIASADFNDIQAGDENYKYAAAAVTYSLISNSEKFRPQDVITAQEAAKICVNVCGFGVEAEQNGGYPKGYTYVAGKLGIFKGVSVSDGGLTAGDAYSIIFNTLKSDYLELSGTGYEMSGDNVLYAYRSIAKTKGIITSNEYTAMGSYDAEAMTAKELSGTIGIDGVIYYADGDFNNLLGCSGAVYIYSGNADERVVFVYPEDNEFAEVKSGDIEFSGGVLTDGKKKYKIAASADIIYNGKVNYSYSIKDIENICGSVRLINNDGDSEYEIVIIEDYYYMKVMSFDKVNMVIRDYCDPKKAVSLDGDVICTVYSDEEQREASLGEVEKESVLAVKRSASGELVHIIILGRAAGGRVSAVSEGRIQIDGQWYEMSRYFEENELSRISAGKTADFYLGINDEIAALSYLDSEMKYGYLVKAYINDEDEKLYIRIFTAAGKMTDFVCREKLTADGKREGYETVYNTLTASHDYTQLIKYSADADNVITKLDFSEKTNFYVDDINGENDDNSLKRQIFGSAYYYRQSTFYPHFNITNTVVFRIPTDRSNYDDYGIGFSFKDQNYNDGTDIEVYDAGLDGMASALVVYADNDASNIDRINPVIILVESIYDALDDEGMEARVVYGWCNGKFVQYYLGDTVKILKWREEAEIEPGDLMRVTLDGDTITAAVIDFVGADRSPNSGDNLAYFNMRSVDCHYQVGSVYSFSNSFAIISKVKGASGYDYSVANMINVKIPDNIAVFNEKTKKISVGSRDDINTYLNSADDASFIVVKQYYSRSDFCVIYKSED